VARFSDFPEGYNPNLKFDLRVDNEGGDLLVPGEVRGKIGVFSRRECLVLVHGFNNHAGEAATAYKGFRSRECGYFDDLTLQTFEKLLGDTFWPGDAKWPRPADWVDFLVYPKAVGTAKLAGPELAALIQRFANIERIHFIGHSLGCRLVLETLLSLYAYEFPLARVGGICLMAAAVPNGMVEEYGRFASLLDDLGMAGAKVLVLHSTKDKVLHYAFPPGQTAAGQGEGWFPTALGRFGPPHGMRGIVFQEPIEGAGHSDYWGHENTKPSNASISAVGDFFRFGDKPREMKSREFKVAREVSWVRDVSKNEW